MIWNGKKRNVILILFGAPSLCDRGIVWRSKRDRFIYAKERKKKWKSQERGDETDLVDGGRGATSSTKVRPITPTLSF